MSVIYRNKRCESDALSDGLCFKHLGQMLQVDKDQRERLIAKVYKLDIEINRLETILEV